MRSIEILIGWAVVAGAVWLLIVGVAAWWWPYMGCRRCKGKGSFRSPTGRAWRDCRKCKGSGKRVRLGRKVWKKFGVAKKNLVG